MSETGDSGLGSRYDGERSWLCEFLLFVGDRYGCFGVWENTRLASGESDRTSHGFAELVGLDRVQDDTRFVGYDWDGEDTHIGLPDYEDMIREERKIYEAFELGKIEFAFQYRE